ncbi:MAG: class I SAM-dependent methyltransferase [Deltaproteobacteria bacterium]|nr:class I SAM-dependent methyltransferase [Deltaproteobacteria bacterium]
MIADRAGSQQEIILDLGIKDANSVLDIGCGNGEKTFFVSQHVKRVIGIDPDEDMIKAAQTAFVRRNLVFQAGRGESMGFPSSSFDAVLLNESLHHIPVEKQAEALRESCRVLEPEGRILITEPLYGGGSFEEILKFYNDEGEQRRCAIQAIEASANTGFTIALKKEIHIEYSCKGFDDLYQNDINSKTYTHWNERNRQDVIDILERCDKTPDGDFIIDYFASVWLLIKK